MDYSEVWLRGLDVQDTRLDSVGKKPKASMKSDCFNHVNFTIISTYGHHQKEYNRLYDNLRFVP